jgi:hypothetical protein
LVLSTQQITAIEAVVEGVETAIDRCTRQLFTVGEAMREHRTLWDRATSVTPKDTDEWRILDREYKQYPHWFKGASPSGYVSQLDSDKFVHLRTVLQNMLEQAEPEVLRSKRNPKKQQLFLSGEEYQAMKALLAILKKAESSVAILDAYLDEAVFDYLDSLNPSVNIRLMTGSRKPIFGPLFAAFVKKRGNTDAKSLEDFHDRFIVIDEKEVYHLGASINRIGKEACMINEVVEQTEIDKFLLEYKHRWKNGKSI